MQHTVAKKSGHEEVSLPKLYEYISESNYRLILISTSPVLGISSNEIHLIHYNVLTKERRGGVCPTKPGVIYKDLQVKWGESEVPLLCHKKKEKLSKPQA